MKPTVCRRISERRTQREWRSRECRKSEQWRCARRSDMRCASASHASECGREGRSDGCGTSNDYLRNNYGDWYGGSRKKLAHEAKADNQEIMERLARVERRLDAEALISERNDLLMAIRTDAENTAEIMTIGKRYFLI